MASRPIGSTARPPSSPEKGRKRLENALKRLENASNATDSRGFLSPRPVGDGAQQHRRGHGAPAPHRLQEVYEAADRATKDKRPVADLIVELGFLSREEPISPRCRLFSAAFEVVFRWFQVVVAAFPAGGGSVLAT